MGADDTELKVIKDKLETWITWITKEERLMAMQRVDMRLKTIVEVLSCEEPRRRWICLMAKDHTLQSGLLYKDMEMNKIKRKLKLVPNSSRKSIVRFHDLAGHFSMDNNGNVISFRPNVCILGVAPSVF